MGKILRNPNFWGVVSLVFMCVCFVSGLIGIAETLEGNDKGWGTATTCQLIAFFLQIVCVIIAFILYTKGKKR